MSMLDVDLQFLLGSERVEAPPPPSPAIVVRNHGSRFEEALEKAQCSQPLDAR
jgi:hypothetical protein